MPLKATTWDSGWKWSTRNYDEWIDVPEAVFARIVGIAGSYRLQLLPTLDVYGEHALNANQADRLVDELEIVAALVNDPVVHKYTRVIAELSGKCRPSVDGRIQTLLIEGP